MYRQKGISMTTRPNGVQWLLHGSYGHVIKICNGVIVAVTKDKNVTLFDLQLQALISNFSQPQLLQKSNAVTIPLLN